MSTMSFEQFEASLRHYFKSIRVSRGLTQVDVAKNGKKNVPQSTIAKFEAGASPNVTLRTIFEMAQAYSIPLSEVVSKAEKQSPKKSKEDSWALIEDEVARFSPKKRSYLSNIMREIIAGDR